MPCRIFHVYMAINVKNRHVCASVKDIRKTCCEIVASGHSIKWVESAKYLGVYLVGVCGSTILATRPVPVADDATRTRTRPAPKISTHTRPDPRVYPYP